MGREHAGVVTGAGGQHRHATEARGEPVAQGGVEVHLARVRLLGDDRGAPLGRGRLGHRGLDVGDDRARVGGGGGAHVDPGVDAGGDHVGAARHRLEATDRRPAAGARGGRVAGRADRGRGGQHRVAAVGQLGGAGVVALSLDADAPAAVFEDRRGDRHGRVEVDEALALLDVEFDERADARERLGVGAERAEPRAGGDPLKRFAPRIGERRRPLAVDGAGHEPRAEARDAEAGALLLGEHDDRDRPLGREPVGAQAPDGVERTRHAERPVVLAAAGHRVEVAARDDRARPRLAPPRPDVAVAVDIDRETEPLGTFDEPRAQIAFGVVEDVSRVAPAPRVATDVGDLGEQSSRGRCAHRAAASSVSSIGTRRPRSRAISIACS